VPDPRPLARPPIVEALVDFRVAFSSPIEPGIFESLPAQLAERFPVNEKKQRIGTELRFEAGKVAQATMTQEAAGVFLRSSDSTQIAQFRTDGFTLNQLAPYRGGEELLRLALETWEQYAAITHPQAVTRLALRYIDKLDLPYKHGDAFTRFLTSPPDLPLPAPQSVSGFLSRVVAHEGETTIVVTQKLESSPKKDPPTVVIDIDAFQSASLPITSTDLAPRLAELRAVKNRVFFALLTEEAVSLYL
jgi:uncharacterized protein (TIGR04255 family)